MDINTGLKISQMGIYSANNTYLRSRFLPKLFLEKHGICGEVYEVRHENDTGVVYITINDKIDEKITKDYIDNWLLS